jgi:hypothetical protein
LSWAEINASYQAELGKYYGNFTNLGDGNYTFYSWINDSAGSSAATETRELVVDTVTPTIEYGIATPANATTTSNNYAWINVSTGDVNDWSAYIDWNNSLVGYWNFEAIYNSTNVTDNSSHSNTGTLTGFGCTTIDCNTSQSWGGSGWTSAGRRGKGLVFDGVDDYVDAGNDSSLNVTPGDFTLEAWIKTNASNEMMIISKRFVDDVGWVTFEVRGDWAGGRLSFTLAADITHYSVNPTNVNDGQWHHVVAVKSGSTSFLYKDGINVSTSPGGDWSISIINNTAPLQIGIYAESYAPFNGSIDEVKIWSRALSWEEINASFSAGAYRLQNNYTSLSDGNYSYYAVVVDAAGNQNQTGVRHNSAQYRLRLPNA